MAKQKKPSVLDRIELVEDNVIYVDFTPKAKPRPVDTIEFPGFFTNMMMTDADLENLLGPITIEGVHDQDGELLYVTIVEKPTPPEGSDPA